MLATYHRLKRGTVYLVKQADAHLCDLDRKIEERILKRAKAREAGDFEAIAQEQNRLGELCIEHKTRLDSMLFFWVVGGAAALAGNGVSLARQYARAAVRENESLAEGVAALRAELKAALADGVGSRQSPPPAPPTDSLGSSSQQILQPAAAANGGASGHDQPADVAAPTEQRLHEELRELASLQRWTCRAAVLGCAASIAATAAVCTSRR